MQQELLNHPMESTADISTAPTPSEVGTSGGTSGWQVFDIVQIVFVSVGFLANLLSLLTLFGRPKKTFQRPTKLLLRQQSLADGCVCAMAFAYVMAPTKWTTGVTWFDEVVCHVWHSQVRVT